MGSKNPGGGGLVNLATYLSPQQQAATHYTMDRLLKCAEDELFAKRTILVKMGRITDDYRGKVKVIAESANETLVAVEVPDWGTRQRARQDIHSIRGDYAPMKVSHEITDGEKLDAEFEKRFAEIRARHGIGLLKKN